MNDISRQQPRAFNHIDHSFSLRGIRIRLGKCSASNTKPSSSDVESTKSANRPLIPKTNKTLA